MEVTQINLNHCDTAQQLLWQVASETKCDVAIIAEPYQVPPNNGNWVTDKAKIAAITTLGKYPFQEVVSSDYEGFVIVKINDIFVCSCYALPRWTIEQFDQMLHNITEELIGRNPIVIGGDLNAWAVEWGSRFTNARGFSLLEGLAKLNIRLVNEGSTSTFRRDGRESIIDVTFCSPSLASNINWRVCDDYTNSDHQAIRYTVSTQSPLTRRVTRTSCKKWKLKEFEKNLFIEALQVERIATTLNAKELTDVVTRACDVTMPRVTIPKNERRPVYWWTEAINTLRTSCLRARRRMQRARTDTDRAVCREVFRVARAALKHEIKLSRRNCFRELCRDVDANHWGNAYRVVMAKLKGPSTPQETCPDKLNSIVEGLFPQHDPTSWPLAPYDDNEDFVERVTIGELPLSKS
ncbi:uncharacterized protein LOC129761126 [Toxorhynchites rutilus septentrionalis]|uniref:uncharacterized protein LOC129761126 n=1 Tax=Toxorhynchites rutilus septentrionalis TaxID=329112 RepID=UPI00247AD3EA|nr:uncharacterized protein LOC129761126 [Toxorhynchites rutilus septentrionalis]